MPVPYDKMRMVEVLVRHEGMRLKPYLDSEGIMTIGVGRNLEDKGISESEAMHLLNNDVQDAYMEAFDQVPGFPGMNGVRKRVMVNMVFNLGITRLKGFRRMFVALKLGDFENASREMLDSKWASQVGNRALELANQMRTGVND
jgi:lysozyme